MLKDGVKNQSITQTNHPSVHFCGFKLFLHVNAQNLHELIGLTLFLQVSMHDYIYFVLQISLGTVTNIEEAVKWLSYTYLYVRMRCNPLAYGLNYNMAEVYS